MSSRADLYIHTRTHICMYPYMHPAAKWQTLSAYASEGGLWRSGGFFIGKGRVGEEVSRRCGTWAFWRNLLSSLESYPTSEDFETSLRWKPIKLKHNPWTLPHLELTCLTSQCEPSPSWANFFRAELEPNFSSSSRAQAELELAIFSSSRSRACQSSARIGSITPLQTTKYLLT